MDLCVSLIIGSDEPLKKKPKGALGNVAGMISTFLASKFLAKFLFQS